MSDQTPAQRLAAIFRDAKAEGRAAFVGYLPAGYPTLDESRTLMATLAQHADLIEVGIPFTDPMMDGPVIQDAANEALANGVRVKDSISAVAHITEAGGNAVVMTYWNPVLQFGPEQYAEQLAAAGGLGMIIPDLLPEEATQWREICARHGLACIYLVAPSTSNERMALTCEAGSGFIYAASHMGVTGAQEAVDSAAGELVARVRETTDLPVGVGLGVKNGEQAAEIATFADGVIVGSALIRAAGDGVATLETLAAELAAGVRGNTK